MTDTRTPFFTIITSTLNAMETIERCIRSVAAQSFRSYEHIVVDGASTDGTAEFLRSQKDCFSYMISEPDTGIYNAWNKALHHARGQWILFLGADDILAGPEALAETAAFISENNAVSGIVYGDVMLVAKESYENRMVLHVLPEDIGAETPEGIRPVLPCQSGVFHHRDVIKKYGPFDESYKICADAKLLLAALRHGKEPAYRVPKVLYKMTLGGVGSEIGIGVAKENLRLMKELDLPFSPISAAATFLKAYFKKLSLALFGEKTAYRIIDLVRSFQGKPPLWK